MGREGAGPELDLVDFPVEKVPGAQAVPADEEVDRIVHAGNQDVLPGGVQLAVHVNFRNLGLRVVDHGHMGPFAQGDFRVRRHEWPGGADHLVEEPPGRAAVHGAVAAHGKQVPVHRGPAALEHNGRVALVVGFEKNPGAERKVVGGQSQGDGVGHGDVVVDSVQHQGVVGVSLGMGENGCECGGNQGEQANGQAMHHSVAPFLILSFSPLLGADGSIRIRFFRGVIPPHG